MCYNNRGINTTEDHPVTHVYLNGQALVYHVYCVVNFFPKGISEEEFARANAHEKTIITMKWIIVK